MKKKAGRNQAQELSLHNTLFVKLLIGFSLLQLVLALPLYIASVINLPTLIVLGAFALILAVIGLKCWSAKPARIVVRILELLITLACLVLVLIQWIVMLAPESEVPFNATAGAYLVWILVVFAQLLLLFFLPVMAATASHGKCFDLVLVRIFSFIQLLLALGFCFLSDVWSPLAIFLDNTLRVIDNLYYDIFYCLCVATTMVLSFVVYPIGFFTRTKERIASIGKKPVKEK